MGKGGSAALPAEAAAPKIKAEPEHVEVFLFNKRVDVSRFLRTHPGGAKALKIFQNRDATEQFRMYHSPAAYKKLAWLAYASLVRGFLTGIVVFATHYGEEHLEGGDHGMTLVEQTALTSRNITGGYVINVLTGYISLQTEHHLLPMMPTAHLDKAQPYVRAFCKKHGLQYRESNLVECVKFNIKALEYAHLLD